jgi:hyperosmotically inducible periplasmic protein
MKKLGLALTLGLALGTGGVAFPSPVQAASLNDSLLRNNIQARIAEDGQLSRRNVSVMVDDGVAVLTGTVATEAEKRAAEKLAHIDGVTAVRNNIGVGANPRAPGDELMQPSLATSTTPTSGNRVEKAGRKVVGAVSDGWITSKVKAQFLNEDALSDSSINVDTTGGVVGLHGTVTSETARERALDIARTTRGVHRVEDHLHIDRK